MRIAKEFLLAEFERMQQQRDNARDVVVAHQAAMDVLQSLLQRLELPELLEETSFADLGLPDPQPHGT